MVFFEGKRRAFIENQEMRREKGVWELLLIFFYNKIKSNFYISLFRRLTKCES